MVVETHISRVNSNCSQVNVTDADRDRPREIVYFLTGPGVDTDEPSSAQFAINSTSGEIYVLKVSTCQTFYVTL